MNRLRGRRFHCYCIGAAKTGTTSVASIFSSAYSSAHEPEAQRTNRLVIDYLEGEIGGDTLKEHLERRDRRLCLELESAHPLGYLSGVLADTFPKALFVVTLREPRSWLSSRLNFHYQTNPTEWIEYRDYFWTKRNKGFAPEELALQKYGLCSLDTYLAQYADHYRRVFTEVPSERRIVILTSELTGRIPDIAAFLGADTHLLIASHSKRVENKISPLDETDNHFVRDRILHHCADIITEFFPKTLGLYQ